MEEKNGDQCSCEFFQVGWERFIASHITKLQDVGGQIQTSQATLAQVCQAYIGKLYMARQPSPATGGGNSKVFGISKTECLRR
jgi:hypothetical protein